MRLPVIILLLFMILISLGGDENYASTFEAYQRDPLIAQNLPPRREKFDGLKFKTALLLVFPPIIYLIIDFLRKVPRESLGTFHKYDHSFPLRSRHQRE